MKKYVLTLLLFVFANLVFAVKVGDVPDLLKPASLDVDGDDFFVVEEATYSIHVYSMKTLQLKYKLGSKGEGPQEFKVRPYIADITPNYILAFGWNKGIWFSREGKMIKEEVLRNTSYNHISSFKDNYTILERYYDRQTGDGGWALVLLNSQFEKIKELTRVDHSVKVEFTNQDRSKLKVDLILPVVAKSTSDDKVFLGNTLKGFYFDVFDHQGNHLYSIDKNDQVEKIQVDDAYKKRLLYHYKVHNRASYESYDSKNFVFSEYLPAFRSFQISDKKIYVASHNEKDGMRELIILDLNGNILNRIFLPLKSVKMFRGAGEDTYTIYKEVLYELIENEENEICELHKTDLSNLPGLKK